MKTYSNYAQWLRHSNSAARFREAYGLADQMDPPLKMACVEALHRIALAEWHDVQDLGVNEVALPGHDETMAGLNSLTIKKDRFAFIRPGWRSDCPHCVASKLTCDEHYRLSQFPHVRQPNHKEQTNEQS